MKWAGISFTQLSQCFGDVQAKLFPLEKDLVVFQHFLSPDRATRVSFLDPYDEYLVGFSKTVFLLSCLSIFSFQRVIKITKCSFSIMVLRASAPGRQILFAVSLWIYLSLQILGWHLLYHPNCLMSLNKVFNFQFVQLFLIVKMGVKTSKMLICQGWN